MRDIGINYYHCDEQREVEERWVRGLGTNETGSRELCVRTHTKRDLHRQCSAIIIRTKAGKNIPRHIAITFALLSQLALRQK